MYPGQKKRKRPSPSSDLVSSSAADAAPPTYKELAPRFAEIGHQIVGLTIENGDGPADGEFDERELELFEKFRIWAGKLPVDFPDQYRKLWPDQDEAVS